MSNETKKWLYFTNVESVAWEELNKFKKEGRKVGMAEVRFMLDPPKTSCKFVVFELIDE